MNTMKPDGERRTQMCMTLSQEMREELRRQSYARQKPGSRLIEEALHLLFATDDAAAAVRLLLKHHDRTALLAALEG